MQHVAERILAVSAMASAPTSTYFGFTMTNNEWADSAIGFLGFAAFCYFQYQSMKDRREQKVWDRKKDRRKAQVPMKD